MSEHEDALICDFAEVYHIYDYQALPVSVCATLAGGLRDGSRCYMALRGEIATPEQTLLAMIVDRLSILIWQKTKAGEKGRDKPKMLMDDLIPRKYNKDLMVFDSADDFERARRAIIERANNGR